MLVRPLSLSFLFAGLLLGCTATVTSGNCPPDSDCCLDDSCAAGGAGAGGAGQGGAGAGGGISASGIAVPWQDLNGEVLDAPDGTLLLVFGSEPAACADPLAEQGSCDPELVWRAEIPLPVELQFAGAAVELSALETVGYGPFFTESQGDGELCSGGGGTLDGLLEVLAIDGANVTIRVSGTVIPEAPVDGERTLLRCGAPTQAAAVALTQAQLDGLNGGTGGGTSSSGQSGGGPSPDRLHVFLDRSAQPAGSSCSDPYAQGQGCAFDREIVTVALDPSAQLPGVYALGSGVDVSSSESGPNGDGTCWGGGSGGSSDGEVEVVSIDASSVHVRMVDGPYGPLDGVASRCP